MSVVAMAPSDCSSTSWMPLPASAWRREAVTLRATPRAVTAASVLSSMAGPPTDAKSDCASSSLEDVGLLSEDGLSASKDTMVARTYERHVGISASIKVGALRSLPLSW